MTDKEACELPKPIFLIILQVIKYIHHAVLISHHLLSLDDQSGSTISPVCESIKNFWTDSFYPLLIKIKTFQRDFNENFAEEVKVRHKLCSCFEIVLVEICQWQTRPRTELLNCLKNCQNFFSCRQTIQNSKIIWNIQGSWHNGRFCVFWRYLKSRRLHFQHIVII